MFGSFSCQKSGEHIEEQGKSTLNEETASGSPTGPWWNSLAILTALCRTKTRTFDWQIGLLSKLMALF